MTENLFGYIVTTALFTGVSYLMGYIRPDSSHFANRSANLTALIAIGAVLTAFAIAIVYYTPSIPPRLLNRIFAFTIPFVLGMFWMAFWIDLGRKAQEKKRSMGQYKKLK